jgi:alginate O-acetyltransferase complex protein AlgJ
MRKHLCNKRHFLAKVSVVMVFLTFLFLPLAGRLMNFREPVALKEKRQLAEMPHITLDPGSLAKFGSAFERYFDDHFAFRDSLIFMSNYIQTKDLSSSPNPKVIIGKEGWLFYRGDNISSVSEGYSLAFPFTEEQLSRLCRYLEARRDWLASKGIRYLFVIAPDKQSIYPEFLPADYPRYGDHIAQVADYLKKHSTIDVVDPRAALMEAKAEHPVYYKTDTHWNEYGGYIAYREIMRHLAARLYDVRTLSLTDFKLTYETENHRDLANMLALGNVIKEEVPRMIEKGPKMAQGVALGYQLPGAKEIDGSPFFAYESARNYAGKLPNAVVLGDSFSRYLVPYLSQSFGRSVFLHIWNSSLSSQDAAVEHERPDVVVDEVVERLLKSLMERPIAQNIPEPDYKELFGRSPLTECLLDSRAAYKGITNLHECTVLPQTSPAARTLSLHSTGEDPNVQLPYFSCPSDKLLVVRMDITTKQDTVLQIYYMTSSSPQYSEAMSVKEPIHKGRNIIYIPLKQQDLFGRLRLDPGKLPGDYLIHSIEIRAIAGDS